MTGGHGRIRWGESPAVCVTLFEDARIPDHAGGVVVCRARKVLRDDVQECDAFRAASPSRPIKVIDGAPVAAVTR